MALIPWQQAKSLVAVDPETGFEIPHIKAADPGQGWIETYTTVPCAPFEGMQMVKITKKPDGTEVTERFDYTFVSMRDFCGRKFYLSRQHRCRYDLVNRYSGEVLFEVEGPRAPLRVLDPAAACEEMTIVVR